MGASHVPPPRNEPILDYAPGSAERASLTERLDAMSKERIETPLVIGGRRLTTSTVPLSAPHRHELVLADVHRAGSDEVGAAVTAAMSASREWAATPFEDRAAIFLRAAELLAGGWRDTLNAATMLGQSKTVLQAEIDAACELIDFWRYNATFAERLYGDQPVSAPGTWNRMDYRPLEGFVLAVTPFNFTSIAGNLPTAPAMMGNVVVWKPSEKQALAAHFTMELLEAAGLPPGVVNLVHGSGAMISQVCMDHPEFSGLHFTGSTEVFQSLWRRVGERIDRYRTYPRLVGETGGKDFVVAHPSASVQPLVVALVRGAFEYQGQKCSAASRAYIPRSLWPQVRDGLADTTGEIPMGDITDFSMFMGAVIDEPSFQRMTDAIAGARRDGAEILVGGEADDSEGWFVEPTVIVTDDPASDTMTRELFGPVLTVYVYDDADWEGTLRLVDRTGPYALTGAVFADDRAAVGEAYAALRQAAGNFYVNDKPTGAVVGQQPFGGARSSGTNDKAGSMLNLVRWTSPRTIKENFQPPDDWRYPHMG